MNWARRLRKILGRRLNGKFHRAIFSRSGNSYPFFHRAALLTPLFPVATKWHRGCNNPCQTKWRASGRFRMDLTARDPSKVPRCILSRFAGVSEAQAEREHRGPRHAALACWGESPQGEILSDPEACRKGVEGSPAHSRRFGGAPEFAVRASRTKGRRRNPESSKNPLTLRPGRGWFKHRGNRFVSCQMLFSRGSKQKGSVQQRFKWHRRAQTPADFACMIRWPIRLLAWFVPQR